MNLDSTWARLRVGLTLTSAIGLVATIGLSCLSFYIEPSPENRGHYWSLSDRCHISVMNDGWHSRLVLFGNDGDYGPYRGSVISLAESPPFERALYFGDIAGVYYRYFHWHMNDAVSPDMVIWTLAIHLFYFVLLFSILPYLFWRRRTLRGSGIPKPSEPG